MAKQVRTYVLAPPFVVDMPRDAKPLAIYFHNGGVYVAMEVDTDKFSERRTFTLAGIGQDIGEFAGEYIGMVEIHEKGGLYRMFCYLDKPYVDVVQA